MIILIKLKIILISHWISDRKLFY